MRPPWPPPAQGRSGSAPEPVIGETAALEAEEFLVPSWTAGVAEAAGTEAAEQGQTRSRKLIREIIETALLALLVFLAVRGTL